MDNEAQTHEMTQYRARLMRQKEFLTDILSKIEKQILALQVERLHLRNTLLGADYLNRETSQSKNVSDEAVTKTSAKTESVMMMSDTENSDFTKHELDLSVLPHGLNNFQEESEESGEDEQLIIDDKEFKDN
ncbi:hypothetical protein DMN91_010318 [Ooceraea biroi]|uniref:Uncharacterized protein n=1 Tax=Ooceraea biroi TaxID=2015173 RepID=A0A026WL92_OOCBI|nr:uncharacterized protein LOC105278383 [Ooceraea biroi]EZA56431.1 hypothetical protein X777_03051 [Ooceraea biroi]RLU18075.1 hypothetical protein DMN91_010318 [Ooceraea biroi]